MFKNLLLPVDLTEKHQATFDIAVNLAKKENGVITFLHVIEVIAGWEDEEAKRFYDLLRESAEGHLGRYTRRLDQEQVAWRSKVLIGSPITEVITFAQENDVDLILVSAPKIDASHPGEGWGSLSWKISMLSPCPVLLVK